MTSPQARKQIYDYLNDKGIDTIPLHKDLSKLLKACSRAGAVEELQSLQNRLNLAIEHGQSSEENKISYQHQLIALNSMLAWTKSRLGKDASPEV